MPKSLMPRDILNRAEESGLISEENDEFIIDSSDWDAGRDITLPREIMSMELSCIAFRLFAHIIHRASATPYNLCYQSLANMAREIGKDRRLIYQAKQELLARNMIAEADSKQGEPAILLPLPEWNWLDPSFEVDHSIKRTGTKNVPVQNMYQGGSREPSGTGSKLGGGTKNEPVQKMYPNTDKIYKTPTTPTNKKQLDSEKKMNSLSSFTGCTGSTGSTGCDNNVNTTKGRREKFKKKERPENFKKPRAPRAKLPQPVLADEGYSVLTRRNYELSLEEQVLKLWNNERRDNWVHHTSAKAAMPEIELLKKHFGENQVLKAVSDAILHAKTQPGSWFRDRRTIKDIFCNKKSFAYADSGAARRAELESAVVNPSAQPVGGASGFSASETGSRGERGQDKIQMETNTGEPVGEMVWVGPGDRVDWFDGPRSEHELRIFRTYPEASKVDLVCRQINNQGKEEEVLIRDVTVGLLFPILE